MTINIQPWHTPFLIWNQTVVPCPVLTVASWPAYRFLKKQIRCSGIPISFRIFHSLIHPVKGFGLVNKAEIDIFLELSCSIDNPTDVGTLISSCSAFSKTSLNIWKFTVHVLLKADLENFEHYSTSMWDECNCAVVWEFFGIAFLWDWNENWPFPVLWPLLSFPNFWHNKYSTFTASFRIWNSSTGIPSPAWALFIVMLPNAHLTFIHGCLALGEWSYCLIIWIIKIFLYSSSMYSFHFFLISSTSVKSIPFLSFLSPFLYEMFPWYL